MGNDSKPDDAKSREAAAESLQRQIDDLVAGRAQPGKPSSFRDFVEQKMAEDHNKRSVAGESSEPTAKSDPEKAPPESGQE